MKKKWSEVRGDIKKSNHQLYELLLTFPEIETTIFEELNYPYGEIVADENWFYTPDKEKKEYVPFCMVLDKAFEMFIDFDNKTSSYKIYNPGEMLGISRLINKKVNHHPGDILQVSAGARNAFMLFSASEINHHSNIESYFGEVVKRPTDLSSHYITLKEICRLAKPSWEAKLLIFPDEIIAALENKTFPSLNTFILEYDIEQWEYYSNIVLYDHIMGHIKNKNNDISVNSFINDAIRHIFTICSGQIPAYALAVKDNLMPTDLFVSVYKEIYKAKTLPIFYQPEYYSGDAPVYYSISKEELAFKPEVFSNQPEKCIQLYNSFNLYAEKVNQMSVLNGTKFSETAKNTKLTMLNEKKVQERHQNYFSTPSEMILEYDPRFKGYIETYNLEGMNFPLKTNYFTGCFGLKNEHN